MNTVLEYYNASNYVAVCTTHKLTALLGYIYFNDLELCGVA